MEQFSLYFQIGRDHILDLSMGLDHILFVFALAAGYLIGSVPAIKEYLSYIVAAIILVVTIPVVARIIRGLKNAGQD